MNLSIEKFNRNKKIILTKIKKYRKHLSIQFSKYHKLKLSDKSWSYLLDLWLYNIISVIILEIEKKKKITFKKKYNNRYSNILIQNSIQICEDKYYLYLKKKINGLSIHEIKLKKIYFKIIQSFYKKIINLFFKLLIFLFNPVLIVDGYFSFKDRFKIFFLSHGKILILSSSNVFYENNSNFIDTQSRKKFKIKEVDLIDKIFNHLIEVFLPKNFLEDFRSIWKSSSFYLKNISILGGGIPIYTSDYYKILALRFHISKKIVLGFQHGFGYNLLNKSIHNILEYSLADIYFYWNNKKGLGLNYLSRFNNIKKKINFIQNNKIIFFLDSFSSKHKFYDYPLLYRESFYKKKLPKLKLFFKYIKPKENFYFKIFPKEFEYKSSINRLGAKTLENENVKNIYPFTKIFISDVISTAFVEAMYLNIPTVLILNKDLNKYGLKKNMIIILNKLAKHGFIQHNFEAAAKFISEIYINTENYWGNKNFQANLIKLKKYLFKENLDYNVDFNLTLKKLIKNSK